MERLSGAPYDIVNPNGLAFIIVSVLPFYYYYAELIMKVRFGIVVACTCVYMGSGINRLTEWFCRILRNYRPYSDKISI